MSRNNYATISRFGSDNSTVNDPLTYCMTQTFDKSISHSPVGYIYGPYSNACQLYMAERCSKNWDGYCSYYYDHNQTQQYPNTVQNPNSNQIISRGLTVGETLLTNAAQRRFCQFPGCVKIAEPFDPTVANSPLIYHYNSNCVPVCSVDPKTIDADPVMNKCLANPNVALDTLVNICNTSKRMGVNLNGTKIGEFCKKFDNNKIQVNKFKTLLP